MSVALKKLSGLFIAVLLGGRLLFQLESTAAFFCRGLRLGALVQHLDLLIGDLRLGELGLRLDGLRLAFHELLIVN